MRLFRNKAAHLGGSGSIFRHVVLQDKSGEFHTFIPRQWPYIWERYMKPSGANLPSFTGGTAELFRETLVHEDIISWVNGLRSRVHATIDAGLSVLNKAYESFQEFPMNSAALAELNGSSVRYEFEYFPANEGTAGKDP